MDFILKILNGVIKLISGIIDFILRVSKKYSYEMYKREKSKSKKIGKKLKNTKTVIDDSKDKLQKSYEHTNNLKAQLKNKNEKIRKLENQLKEKSQKIEELQIKIKNLKTTDTKDELNEKQA